MAGRICIRYGYLCRLALSDREMEFRYRRHAFVPGGPFFPCLFFTLFIVWPTALFLSLLVSELETKWPRKYGWAVWPLSGALLGGPVLFLYSLLLGLGTELLLSLFGTGAVLGLLCAGIMRAIIGTHIFDITSGIDAEASG